ncbi:MAG TPA: glycosyltransferase family 4 protein [Coxiellaceae bacterium]|nr:glycosyltransferase family 4 protein [Coxiellaceae bacterium]
MAKLRLAWLATHPVQYQVPLLRAIAACPDIELKVFYFSDFSTRGYVDREFGRAVEWDVPLLEGYDYEFITQSQSDGISFLQPRIASLTKYLNARDFDAVMTQGWNHYGYIAAVHQAKHANLKLLLRCEATDHVSRAQGLKAWLREKIVHYILKRADHLLAIGSRNRDFYLARGVDAKKVGLMPYCVDNDYFSKRAALADKEALRQSLNLDPERPIILYASKLTSRKYADLLLEAYADLPEPRPYLLIIGEGELKPKLIAQIKNLQLNDVHLLGFRNQSELPAWYALADIFVLPSINETWGLVVNEAMNAGCAIIATTEVGSALDLVKEAENGFVIPPCDRAALRSALQAALSNKTYQRMGQRSGEIIAQWGIKENVIGLRKALGLDIES